MVRLSSVLSGVEILAALSYMALVGRLLSSGRFMALPFFFSYCALMAVDMIWSPTTIREALWIQPWLLSLRLCAAIEAMSLIAGLVGYNHRRYLLLFVLWVGLAGSLPAIGFHATRDLAGSLGSSSSGMN